MAEAAWPRSPEGGLQIGLAVWQREAMLGLGRLNPMELLGIIGHPSELMERSGNQFGLVVAPAGLFGRVERNWDDR